VPHVERLHLQMSDLLFGGPEGKPGDGLIDGEDLAPGQRIRAQRDASTLFSSEEERPPR